MLVQLHAQNPSNPKETEFLMQGEVHTGEDMDKWTALCDEKWGSFAKEFPNGWMPMICSEHHGRFVWAATPATLSALEQPNQTETRE